MPLRLRPKGFSFPANNVMAMIKDALSALPAKPAFYLAPILVVIVLSFYYRDQYNKCVEIKQNRAALNEHLRSLGSQAQFRLADFTNFAWNKVRIVADVKPDTISETCPLDWNWGDGERDALIASGHLTAIIFGQQGQVVRYLELRADEVTFRGAEDHLTPETAVFEVSRPAGSAGSVTLTLKH